MGDRTAEAWEVKVTESKFSDDVGMYTCTRVVLEQVAGEFTSSAGRMEPHSDPGEDQAAIYGVADEA